MIGSSLKLRSYAARFSRQQIDSVLVQRSSLCHVSSVIPGYSTVPYTAVTCRIAGSFRSSSMQIYQHQLTKSHLSTAPALQNDKAVIPFLLADIGEGIHEVELIKWNVQVGDTVEQFDLICQVQSDKATVDITSRFDGTILELSGKVGDMIQVGKPLVFLETCAYTDSLVDANDTMESSAKSPHTTMMIDEETTIISESLEGAAPVVSPNSSVIQGSNVKIQTSPAVRKLCKEKAIDPSVVPATGPQGRLLKADVLAFVDSNQSLMDKKSIALETEVASHNMDGEIVELRGYTRAMAKAMTQSLEIPHMCLGDEIDVTHLLAIRKEINSALSKNLSLLAFIVKACSIALKDFPVLNAAKNTESSIRMQSQHQIGVAMDTARGLVVPVIGDCAMMSISEIQEKLDSLKENRDEIALDSTRPTFTLSNIGALGAGLSLQPVLVPPQLAMGAIGRLQKLPRFGKNDEVIASSVLPITWTADHRYVDGAQLARFHVRVQELLSNPFEMMVHMK
ncbi:2-oxoisovalerate dehydrogenase E2 component [Fistulifera solaris]|uniref:Dihydrolipoamide acetyltransferase component of pyruvate dehydrogenase complex n=1 Tax=Fistulifera solaris TaxID=1519565 RepID=A0A1Z5JCH0_FISSO|nr:2-oxoisovalerate dehydrogenase E2 component [Fistulifera solaris]|eukprot:GAX11461.1 2-oxoisovalerate dehydrogenase E2 component [Fistulifera solaris]